jgi:hypothetical protein
MSEPKTAQRGGVTHQAPWPAPTPLEWPCPRCGSRYLIVGLSPRCATCGFLES